MFNLGSIASSVLNSIDNVAKETLEEPKLSATAIRSRRRAEDWAGAESGISDVSDLDSDHDQEARLNTSHPFKSNSRDSPDQVCLFAVLTCSTYVFF